MRKRVFILFMILFSLLVYAFIAVIPNGHSIEILGIGEGGTELPFKKGERLTYEVRYKGAKIGKSILTFHGETKLENKEVYYITFSTRVPSFKDTEDLYADKDTFLPVRVNRNIRKTIGFNDRIVEKYDHALVLNDKMKIDFSTFDFMQKLILVPFQPTCENLLLHYAELIKAQLPSNLSLHSLFLRETPTSFAEWYADDN